MPFAIDEEALASPNMQILDIGKPPVKQIPYADYPRMVYLHPSDKTKEHRTKIVQNKAELDAAQAKGWRKEPHIPQAAPEDLSGFETHGPK